MAIIGNQLSELKSNCFQTDNTFFHPRPKGHPRLRGITWSQCRDGKTACTGSAE